MKSFSWERGPFETCMGCDELTLGILSAGGQKLTKRCTNCRRTVSIPLPELNKKAVYLDQFMFSLIYNVKNDGNLLLGHDAFAKEVYALLRRCVLLQQIFLPHSDIHHDETTVFHSATDLRGLYEFFGGDVTLKDRRDVELAQILTFAEAFFDNKEPEVSFSLNEVSEDQIDVWLPDMHVGVKTNYSQFANDIRRVRDEGHEALKNLAQQWKETKPSFDSVLANEFAQFGPVKIAALIQWFQKMLSPDPDPISILDTSMSPISREFRALQRLLEKRGVPQDEHLKRIKEFWDSEGTREIPHNKISSYLFAAVSKRIVMGAKKIVDQGLLNDVNTVSTYAPYMDAMFIDKTCASLLAEKPLTSALEYKAQIFSLRDTDAFISYLKEIEAGTPDEVREYAAQIYGVE